MKIRTLIGNQSLNKFIAEFLKETQKRDGTKFFQDGGFWVNLSDKRKIERHFDVNLYVFGSLKPMLCFEISFSIPEKHAKTYKEFKDKHYYNAVKQINFRDEKQGFALFRKTAVIYQVKLYNDSEIFDQTKIQNFCENIKIWFQKFLDSKVEV